MSSAQTELAQYEESLFSEAKVSMTRALDSAIRVAFPEATMVEALAAAVAEWAANRDEIEEHADIVVDLENLAAKWRGRLR